MKKILLIVDDHPSVKQISDEMDTRGQFTKKKVKDLAKQIEEIRVEHNKAGLALWDKIEQYLKDNNKLPDDYSKDKYVLCEDAGAIMLYDHKTYEQKQMAEAMGIGIPVPAALFEKIRGAGVKPNPEAAGTKKPENDDEPTST